MAKLPESDSAVDGMVLHFWGVRGTLPVPGKNTVRYGGNTNCITLTIAGKHFFIFDAGTGIKELSNYLVEENKLPIHASIFISHPHYDHINGIPFFIPFYNEGNVFDIYGTTHGDHNIEKLIAGQMDNVYFPTTISSFGAKLNFHNLMEETFKIDDVEIKTIFLNHPGRCIGFKVKYQDKFFCYITDNELYLLDCELYKQPDVDRLIAFIHDTDFVVIDTTFTTDEEYEGKKKWGHSCVSRVIDVADKAKVKTICLFHHDPSQLDDDIDAKLKLAQTLLKERNSATTCIAAHEGQIISI
jgi:phosphoribosyl 1,2-cyclic phosphodiesterase